MRKLLSSLFILLMVAASAVGQERTITGTVTDQEDKSPLPGVSVRVKGTTVGTQTGANGEYSIRVPEGSKTLTFTYIGYATKDVNIGSGSVVNAVLTTDATQLGEVVVTALGVSREKKALGYSVSKVESNEIIQKSEPDPLKALQGKAAGVDIRTSQGTPGGATRIQIRGNSSFTGNNQPLIIVDGVPYSNDQVSTSDQTSGGGAYSSGLSSLDPNDIATMDVLKGSAAAALYGSRASNGVVLITTKSGSARGGRKGLEVNFRTSASFENIANLPDYQNTYGAGSYGNYSASNGSWGPAFGTLDSIPVWAPYKAAFPEMFPGANIAYRAYPNNVKDLFRTGEVYENSININGGDDRNAVSVTASQLNHSGYVSNSSFDRTNIGLGGSSKLSMGLNVRGNLSYSRQKQTGGVFGENQVDGAASQFARSLFLARNWDLNLPYEDEFGNNVDPLGGSQFDNPHWSAKYNTVNTAEERFVANMGLDFKINSWAKVDYSLGSNVRSFARREITEISSRAAEGLGRLILNNYRSQEIESNLLLTLSPKIHEDFTFRGVVGANYNQRSVEDVVQTGSQFIARGIHTLNNTKQQAFTDDFYSRRRLLGVFGDVSLGYKDYAYLNFTGRNDWSSTLPTNNRSYFYPSISGSFVFTDAFDIGNEIIDFGKVRAGWAKVGRDADPYSLQDVFIIGTNFLGQSTADVTSVSYDPNLKPEFTREFEVGTQLSFLQSRIGLDFTWYNKTSTNLIAPITTPASSGYSQYYTNYGKINNKGVEVELTLRPVKTASFSWDLMGAFTKNKNVVKELTEGVSRFSINGVLTSISPYVEAGLPYGYLRGTKSLRDESGNLLINPATGALIEDAINQHMVGDPNPDYKLGITNTLSYKNFSLSALFDMTKGGDIYSVTVSSLLGRGVTKDTEDRNALFVIPGVYGDPSTGKAILDANGNTIPNTTRLTQNDLWFSPNATLGQTFAINTATEWNVYDATVYRLREITLAYRVPKSVFKKLPIGDLTVSVSGRNLWYLAPNIPKYTNFDPEVNSFGTSPTQGIELSAAPTTRRYGVNLSVTF